MISPLHVISLTSLCRNCSHASVSHVHDIIWVLRVALASGGKITEQVRLHLCERQPEVAHHIKSKC